MPGRLGPRFAIETLFLIALAVGAAYADLDAKWIVLVMAGGWLIVALLELTAERIWAAVPPWRRPNYYSSAVVSPQEPEPALEPAEAEPEPEPEAEAATVIGPVVEPAAAVEEAEPAAEADPEPEEPKRPTLEPLEPRPRRRWFRRRVDAEPAPAPPPELPKHVRLLPPPSASRVDEDVAEIAEGAEHERRA
jgi:hypothetical protein